MRMQSDYNLISRGFFLFIYFASIQNDHHSLQSISNSHRILILIPYCLMKGPKKQYGQIGKLDAFAQKNFWTNWEIG